MHFIKILGPIVMISLFLTMTACSNPAMEVVPTPTPRDAALERLLQSPQEGEPSAGTQAESGAGVAGSTGGGDGQELFTANGCIACHMLEGDATIVGPNLSKIGATAAERIAAPDYTGEATTAEEYIHESIVNPNVFIVPDFVPAMPPTYEQSIPPDQLDQLVSYLASLQ